MCPAPPPLAQYFINLLTKKWTERQWEGNRQFEDETGTLMMLPTDVALIEDAAFRPHVERYAADAAAFASEFSAVFAKVR
jgi:catalase (peroxidase I)